MLVCSLVLSACDILFSQDEIEYVPVVGENYADGFKYVQRRTVAKEDVPKEYRDEELELNTVDYDVTYETVTATSSYDDLCAYGVNDQILFPGALVDMSNGAYTAIPLARAPITISANLETLVGVNASLSETIKDPELSSVRNGIRTIVNNNLGKGANLPSNFTYEIKEVTNENEFLMNLGMGLQVSKFAMSEDFSYANIKKQTNLVMILKQVYYTIDMDHPSNGVRGFFASNLSNDKIEKTLTGKVPAYVASVAYGRIAIISIQSNYSKSDIENEIRLSWGQMSDNPGKSPTKKLSAELDNTLKSIASDSETTINCFIYGGNSTTQMQIGAGSDNLSDIFNMLNSKDSSSGEGALPISYTLRNLDSSIAKIQNCNEYTIKHIKYNAKKLMSWDHWNELRQSKEIDSLTALKFDLTSMLDYTNIEGSPNNAKITLQIPANIDKVYLIGPNANTKGFEYNNLGISVAGGRSGRPLYIYLDNISFNGCSESQEGASATNDGMCIYADPGIEEEVIIVANGTVNLIGQPGSPAISCKNLVITAEEGTSGHVFTVKGGAGSNGSVGSAAIVATNVTLDMPGALTIRGGTGGNGAEGKEQTIVSANSEPPATETTAGGDGGTGGVAINCTSLSIINGNVKLYGGNGGTGGVGGSVIGEGSYYDYADLPDGGNGGNGGNGGAPINANTQINISKTVPLVLLQYGDGGNGGAGGKGGDAEFRKDNMPDGKGHGGTGGKGGDGFNGGNAGLGGQGGASYTNHMVYGVFNKENRIGTTGDGGKGNIGGNSITAVKYENGTRSSVNGTVGVGSCGGKCGIQNGKTNDRDCIWGTGYSEVKENDGETVECAYSAIETSETITITFTTSE